MLKYLELLIKKFTRYFTWAARNIKLRYLYHCYEDLFQISSIYDVKVKIGPAPGVTVSETEWAKA